MRKNFCLYFFIPGLIMLFSIYGCAPLLLGMAVGGVGIYSVSKDTAQGDADKSFDSLWRSALTVSKIRGKIKQENYSQGYIELETGSNRAWIKIIRLTRVTNRLKISARKYHLPNLKFAQELFMKILEEAG
ncbi:hypothetical protein D4R78_01375 [bacterium]|nr:MAG: hypothetical protein D4R78_01375 [bacterium]